MTSVDGKLKMACKGTLKKVLHGKHYGFIECERRSGDVFVHFSDVSNAQEEELVVGSQLMFEPVENIHTGRSRAANVWLVRNAECNAVSAAERHYRGAGIIALLCKPGGDKFVCIVEKNNSVQGFPKGGSAPMDRSDLVCTALREWLEEAGIAVARLRLLLPLDVCLPVVRDGVSSSNARVLPEKAKYLLAEERIGIRYFAALCDDPSDRREPDWHEYQNERVLRQWKPPFEDPNDRDPIVRASWVNVNDALKSGSLSKSRKSLLRLALEEIQELKIELAVSVQGSTGLEASEGASSSVPEAGMTTAARVHGGNSGQTGKSLWVELCDPRDGEPYYWCPKTGIVSWNEPESGFVELSDRDGVNYYWCVETGATSWYPPLTHSPS